MYKMYPAEPEVGLGPFIFHFRGPRIQHTFHRAHAG